MDNINVIDPSYGNPTDGTGSLVSNRIKFKELSRKRIQDFMAKKLSEMDQEKIENMKEEQQTAASEVVSQIAETPTEEITDEVLTSIKEKSDYAKKLETKIEAIEAGDIDKYTLTARPIKFEDYKPLKLKGVNYPKTYKNGKLFSTRVEVENKDFSSDITEDNFEKESVDSPAVDVYQVAKENEEQISENVNNAMNEQLVDNAEGFVPVASEMEEVQNVLPQEENIKEVAVEDSEEKELTEDDIRNEIDKIMSNIDTKEEKDTNLINSIGEMAEDDNDLDDLEEVKELTSVEPIRELPLVAPEREEDVVKELDVDENLHYDYSDVTEKDIENINSVELLAEMRKALETKQNEVKNAQAEAEQAEAELKLSFEEVDMIRKRAEEKEKSKQETVAKFNAYVKSYDKDIAEAMQRKEKADEGKAKNDQEIADYEADIASNDDLMENLISMMESNPVETEENEKRM